MRGTNTYLIGKGHQRVLIDTGEGKASWPRLLASVLSSEGATVTNALLTHWHPDHVGGVKDLLTLCKGAIIHKHHPVTTGQSNIEDGQIFQADGATLRAFHCPGHTADHMAFILKEEDAMFTGDNVLGHGTAVFENLALYLQSLKLMSQQFSGRAYPAHGALILNGPERVREYIVHRQQREEEVLEILRPSHARSTADEVSNTSKKGGPVAKAWTAKEIVKIIYKDVSPNLHEAAEKGILQMLRKLSQEGKVFVIEGGGVGDEEGEAKWQISPKSEL